MEICFLYAVEKNNLIQNVIVGQSAESGEILSAMLPDSFIIQVTETTGQPIIGGDFFEGVFRSQKPFDSWVWSSPEKSWTSPVPRPVGPYWWDESGVDWLPIPSE